MSRLSTVALVVYATGTVAMMASGQELAQRGPVFYSVRSVTDGHIRDVRNAAILRQSIALNLNDVGLREALDSIEAAAHVSIVYTTAALPPALRVSLQATRITLGAALTVVLTDAGLDVELTPDGVLSLTPRAALVIRFARDTVSPAGTVAGRVSDAKTGESIGGVTVMIEGLAVRALTSDAGEYVMRSVKAGSYMLVAQRLGYAPARVAATVRADSTVRVDFALTMSAQHLEEIVTTATGDETRRRVGNDIATIAADSVVATGPITDLADVISGRVAGVQVYLNGGLTGASPEITIRGQNSFTVSNQPLLYVDGVRVENSPATANQDPNAVTNEVFAGRFNDLDPEEIASIEVVKGPSAATLYGTDAANGVILVKTKRGRAGRPRWDAYAEHGLLTLDKNRLWNVYYAFGHTPGPAPTPVQCFNLERVAGQCVLDSLSNFDPLKSSATTPVGTGYRGAYGLQTSGGSDATRYFIAGGYEDEVGVLTMPSKDRAILTALRGAPLGDNELRPNAASHGTGRANLTTTLGRTADIGVSVGLIHQDSRIPSPDVWAAGARGPGYRDANDGWAINPGRPAQVLATTAAEDVWHFTPSTTTTWHPFPWLAVHGTGGVDFSSDLFDELLRAGEGAPGTLTGRRTNQKTNITLYTADLGTSASFDLSPAVTSKTSFGAQYNRRLDQVDVAQALNLAPGTTTVAGGATQIARESSVEAVVAGAYAEQTFGFHDRLFLTGAARIDGASAFGTDFKTAVYPKASVSWLVFEEPSVRLRAAYGGSGVQPASTAALPFVNVSPAVVNGNATTGATVGGIGNPHLGPERQTEIETGVDAELLHSRIQIEATYYWKRSTGALVNVPLPVSDGIMNPSAAGSILENVGSVDNNGYEATVTARPIQGRAVAWELTLNGSVNHNKVISLAPGLSSAVYGEIVPGYPLFSFIGPRILSYADANHDGVLEPNEVVVSQASTFLGQVFPKAQLTIATTLTLLGRLQIGAQFDYRGGYTQVDQAGLIDVFTGTSRGLNDPHASLAEQARAVAELYDGVYSGYLQNGWFMRLRELSLTYTLPATLTRPLAAHSASITLAGRNLALWTPFRGVDPESNTQPGGSGLTGTSDYAYYTDASAPPSQYWILRVRIGW